MSKQIISRMIGRLEILANSLRGTSNLNDIQKSFENLKTETDLANALQKAVGFLRSKTYHL